MPLHVVILSVPHSGTHLLEHILGGHGFRPAKWCREPENSPSYRRAHLTDLGATQRALLTDDPIIVPLRHPYRVEESWRRRHQGLPWSFFEAWENLVRLVLPRDPLVLPVDAPDRDRHLERLGRSLGVELQTDWPIRRSKAGTYGLALEEITPSERVRSLAGELAPLLDRFY